MKVSKSKRQVPVEPEYETVYHLTLTDHEAQALRKVCALVSGPPSGTRGIFDQIATGLDVAGLIETEEFATGWNRSEGSEIHFPR